MSVIINEVIPLLRSKPTDNEKNYLWMKLSFFVILMVFNRLMLLSGCLIYRSSLRRAT